MVSRIPILLDEKAAAGLVALAKQEYRDPRQQAAIIVRQELVKLGFLTESSKASKQIKIAETKPEKVENGNPS